MQEKKSVNNFYTAYLSALLKGDADLASGVIKEAFDSGLDVKSIHMKVICAAQVALGELWACREISITQEHIATEISMLQLSWLRFHAVRKPPLRLDILVTVPPEEQHIFPARLIADQFLLDGWQVHFTGLNTPAEEIISFLKSRKIDVVAFSITSKPHQSFDELLKRIKAIQKPPLIVVGGQSADAVKHLSEVDVSDLKSIEDLKYDERFASSNAEEAGFLQLKNVLGQKIIALRQERRMSQQKLAREAHIDRAYLSALENGKQNPSIHILYKIASATGVNLGELVTL